MTGRAISRCRGWAPALFHFIGGARFSVNSDITRWRLRRAWSGGPSMRLFCETIELRSIDTTAPPRNYEHYPPCPHPPPPSTERGVLFVSKIYSENPVAPSASYVGTAPASRCAKPYLLAHFTDCARIARPATSPTRAPLEHSCLMRSE